MSVRNTKKSTAPKPSWVYFIRQGDSGPIKIGRTTDSVESRIAAMQTGQPEKLVAIGQVPETPGLERRLHELFGDARLMGEWFEPTNDVLEFINDACGAGEATSCGHGEAVDAARGVRDALGGRLRGGNARSVAEAHFREVVDRICKEQRWDLPTDVRREAAYVTAVSLLDRLAMCSVLNRVGAYATVKATGPALLAVHSTLGVTRRHAAEICRAGRVPGAVIIGRMWRSPQSGIDAYLASLRGARRTQPTDDVDDEATAEDVLRSLGAVLACEESEVVKAVRGRR